MDARGRVGPGDIAAGAMIEFVRRDHLSGVRHHIMFGDHRELSPTASFFGQFEMVGLPHTTARTSKPPIVGICGEEDH